MNPIDSINQAVIEKLQGRAKAGLLKYGVTMDRGDLTHKQWLQHLQDELMDALVYTEKLIRLETLIKEVNDEYDSK